MESEDIKSKYMVALYATDGSCKVVSCESVREGTAIGEAWLTEDTADFYDVTETHTMVVAHNRHTR